MSRAARLFAAILLLATASSLACRQTIIAEGSRPSAAPTEDGRIPAAAFFRRPLLSHVTLSPDGQHIAAIASKDGLERLIVRPTYGSDVRTLTKLERTSRRVSWRIRKLGWASNSHLIVSVEMPSEAAVGVRARQSRLMVVALDGSKIRYLGRNWPHQEYSGMQDDIVSWLWDDPDRILLSIWIPGQTQRGIGARTVNIRSGSLRTVVRARYGTMGWATDHEDQVRVGWGQPDSGTDYFWYARITPEDSFKEIIRYNPHEEEGFSFADFSEEPQDTVDHAWLAFAVHASLLQSGDRRTSSRHSQRDASTAVGPNCKSGRPWSANLLTAIRVLRRGDGQRQHRRRFTHAEESSRAGAQRPEEAVPVPQASVLAGTAASARTGSTASPGLRHRPHPRPSPQTPAAQAIGRDR